MHASDQFYAWARDQRRDGGATALAEDRVAAELQATQQQRRCAGGGPETSRGGTVGRRTLSEPAAGVMEWRLREPESTHCWTGTTCRAAPLACSDLRRGTGRRRWRAESDGQLNKMCSCCCGSFDLICRWGAGYTPWDLLWQQEPGWPSLFLVKSLKWVFGL
jgi:hypothetical protein